MKNECLKRLEELKLKCIDDFKNDKILVSDNGNLRKLNVDEFGVVDDLQEKYGIMIYHVIKDELGFSILFVSSYEEDWEFEKPEIFSNKVHAEGYCYNETDNYLSEFGAIEYEIVNGTLKRIG